MSAPLVYAIVLNWNRPEDTTACVRSLQEHTYSGLRILIVDNAHSPCHEKCPLP
jgi:GT2 family glycosyltransferase